MAKDSFKEQYPDYELKPIKSQRWIWALAWTGFLGAVAAVGLLLYQFSQTQTPTPNMVGVNKFTLGTKRNLAISQFEAGRFNEAAQSFSGYFALGGDDKAAMELYAQALTQIGMDREARVWRDKARVRALESDR